MALFGNAHARDSLSMQLDSTAAMHKHRHSSNHQMLLFIITQCRALGRQLRSSFSITVVGRQVGGSPAL